MKVLIEHGHPGGYPFTGCKSGATAKAAFGLHLRRGNERLVYSRPVRRLLAQSLSSVADECLLLNDPGEMAERASKISALTTTATHLSSRLEAIFCRKVAIYFIKSTQQHLWQRIAERLAPGGLLLIGHSTRLSGSAAALFSSPGSTVHRRVDATPAHPRGIAWD